MLQNVQTFKRLALLGGVLALVGIVTACGGGGGGGSPEMTIVRPPPTAAELAAATPIKVGQTITGTLESADDVHYNRLVDFAEEGEESLIEVTLDAPAGTEIALLDSEGAVLDSAETASLATVRAWVSERVAGIRTSARKKVRYSVSFARRGYKKATGQFYNLPQEPEGPVHQVTLSRFFPDGTPTRITPHVSHIGELETAEVVSGTLMLRTARPRNKLGQQVSLGVYEVNTLLGTLLVQIDNGAPIPRNEEVNGTVDAGQPFSTRPLANYFHDEEPQELKFAVDSSFTGGDGKWTGPELRDNSVRVRAPSRSGDQPQLIVFGVTAQDSEGEKGRVRFRITMNPEEPEEPEEPTPTPPTTGGVLFGCTSEDIPISGVDLIVRNCWDYYRWETRDNDGTVRLANSCNDDYILGGGRKVSQCPRAGQARYISSCRRPRPSRHRLAGESEFFYYQFGDAVTPELIEALLPAERSACESEPGLGINRGTFTIHKRP